MYSQTEENYLKAIYKLSENNGAVVNTNAIAELLSTKAASVTDMIKKLSDKKLLKYEKYHGVILSEKGLKVAVSVIRKHRLWECFLYDKLKFGWDEVHEIAEQLEHIHSELLVDKLDAYLGYPSVDPHGDVIPGKNGEIKKLQLTLLTEISIASQVVMSGVVDHTTVFLKYLDQIGIKLGDELTIIEQHEFDGSLLIKLNHQAKPQLISREVARNILVRIK